MKRVALLLLLAACARRLPEPELQARCEDGLGGYCLDLGYSLLDRGDIEGAVRWLDRACAREQYSACGELQALHGTAWASLPAMERALAATRPACARGGTMSCELTRELESRSAALRAQEEQADAAIAEKVGRQNADRECGPGKGGLEKDDLKTVIIRHSPDVRACYERSMWRDLELALDVTVSWTIDATGRVTKADVTKNTRPDSSVGECIRQVVLTWRFPPPACGGTVNVSFPWLLRVGSAEP